MSPSWLLQSCESPTVSLLNPVLSDVNLLVWKQPWVWYFNRENWVNATNQKLFLPKGQLLGVYQHITWVERKLCFWCHLDRNLWYFYVRHFILVNNLVISFSENNESTYLLYFHQRILIHKSILNFYRFLCYPYYRSSKLWSFCEHLI